MQVKMTINMTYLKNNQPDQFNFFNSGSYRFLSCPPLVSTYFRGGLADAYPSGYVLIPDNLIYSIDALPKPLPVGYLYQLMLGDLDILAISSAHTIIHQTNKNGKKTRK